MYTAFSLSVSETRWSPISVIGRGRQPLRIRLRLPAARDESRVFASGSRMNPSASRAERLLPAVRDRSHLGGVEGAHVLGAVGTYVIRRVYQRPRLRRPTACRPGSGPRSLSRPNRGRTGPTAGLIQDRSRGTRSDSRPRRNARPAAPLPADAPSESRECDSRPGGSKIPNAARSGVPPRELARSAWTDVRKQPGEPEPASRRNGQRAAEILKLVYLNSDLHPHT